MKIGDRDYVLVPMWIFGGVNGEKMHPDCNKFLLSIFEDNTAEVDGCHGEAQEVAKAKTLIARLGLGPKERRSVMITVEEVPEFTGKVNEEAIATLAPVIKKYKNRKGVR